MPSGWLSVPHFQQELEYSCVAACVRIVLATSERMNRDRKSVV